MFVAAICYLPGDAPCLGYGAAAVAPDRCGRGSPPSGRGRTRAAAEASRDVRSRRHRCRLLSLPRSRAASGEASVASRQGVGRTMAAKRGRPKPAVKHFYPQNRRRTYLGDIRAAPFAVGEGGEPAAPYFGLWADADTGEVVSTVVAIERPAEALAEALVNPTRRL